MPTLAKKAVFFVDAVSDTVHFFGFVEPGDDLETMALAIQGAIPGALVYDDTVTTHGTDPDTIILTRNRTRVGM